MAKEEKKDKEAAPEEAPKKGGKKMLIIIVAAVLVLLLGGGGLAFALMGGAEKKPDEHVEENLEPDLKLAKLDVFIVNLSETNTFLKVALLVEYDQHILDRELGGHGEGGGHGDGGGASGGGEEGAPVGPGPLPHAMKEREPMIRDAVIRVLSSKKSTDVLTADGKESLKQELVEAINESLGFEEGPVQNVYFSEFIIQ